ncbi:MAG: hypothetical protein HN350_06675 [Phycisphaerales bacterium]|jgi:hypothetical protein|nr:hypothetical protein [Phycisphaerales bacterium]
MMRKSVIAVLLTSIVLIGGCGIFAPKSDTSADSAPAAMESNSVQGDSMILTIEIPKRRYQLGECIDLRITATNTSQEPIVFRSPTTAGYKVTIYRMTAAGWRWVNQYPQAAMQVKKVWTLQAAQSVKYNQSIPVMRDWPMDEALRMVVELDGGPDVKCPMIISASAKIQD